MDIDIDRVYRGFWSDGQHKPDSRKVQPVNGVTREGVVTLVNPRK